MYKVYFAVYLSLQKCGNFKNIRHFFVILFAYIKDFQYLRGHRPRSQAHEPTSKLLHPNAVHTLAVRNYEQAPIVLQKSIADR